MLWALCLLIGLAGSLLGYAAGSPTVVLPYALAAAGLLLIHAPRRRLFTSRRPRGLTRQRFPAPSPAGRSTVSLPPCSEQRQHARDGRETRLGSHPRGVA